MSRFLAATLCLLCLLSWCRRVSAADNAGYLSAYSFYDQAFADGILTLDAYKPLGNPRKAFRMYVGATLNRTSSPVVGDVAQLYFDNYALAAAGAQYVHGGLRLFAQGGYAAEFGSVAVSPSALDFRTGAQFSHGWGGSPTYGNFYGSAVYFSRYQDTVLYNQVEAGSVQHGRSTPIDLYVRATLTLDTRRFYYDTVGEAIAGTRLHLFGPTGPTLQIEAVAGRYLENLPRPDGYTRDYTDFRPSLTYGVSI